MGSIGLTALEGYTTVQAAAGGNRAQGRYLECVARGTVASCANTLRTAAVESGGFIAAARNPVRADYLRKHAAVGASRWPWAWARPCWALSSTAPPR